MFRTQACSVFIAALLLVWNSSTFASHGQNASPTPTPAQPPAPVLVSPASGASLVQPINLSWNPPPSTVGPIGRYTWQVSTSSTFSIVVASGFTNQEADPSIPIVLSIRSVASQTAPTSGGSKPVNPPSTVAWIPPGRHREVLLSPGWDLHRATPLITTPAGTSQFHIRESFPITWTAVQGAQYYILEADDEPSFSYPLTLTQTPLNFGTFWGALWGNALTAYYRVRAVSIDGVRSLPSAAIQVQITDSAPIPPGVSPVAPASGATVQLPFFIDWSDTPNPQVPGYDVEFNTSPNFHTQYLCSGVEPKPLRLHDHA